jgi:hypothetical protein
MPFLITRFSCPIKQFLEVESISVRSMKMVGHFLNHGTFPMVQSFHRLKKYTMTMVTVGRAKDGELTEEMIIYDMSTMMRQLGLMDQSGQ